MTPEQAKALREPFPPETVGKLPKPTRKENPKGNCKECGGFHGLPAIHLDYIGHAAVTHRLLEVDPDWTWEPFALTTEGLPALDRAGNLWIKLTVCGVTRPGVGDASNAKEIISDAIRNAAMRFGVALDLWSKEELHPQTGAPASGDQTQREKNLLELVDRKGGDIEKTRQSIETAKQQGKFEHWISGAEEYWSKQTDSYANRIPEAARTAA